jgi:GTP-binding protein HflX
MSKKYHVTTQESIERAILVHIDFSNNLNNTNSANNLNSTFDYKQQEFEKLVTSTGAQIVAVINAKRDCPDVRYFLSKGKKEELLALSTGADVIIFNHSLSAVQHRNLEKLLNKKVIDRVHLILDIFSLRAKSHIGKLQVELALLKHLSSRLIHLWTHLERQKGGIGLRSGSGEKQLELDKRGIQTRMSSLEKQLKQLHRHQQTQRKARLRQGMLKVCLVGYTNSGKSTLFKRLTKENVYIQDQLFATLDTTVRRFYVPEQGNISISDTVGFIEDLPHQLIQAFRGTLDEVIHADVLLHVIDTSSPNFREHIHTVQKVLQELWVNEQHIMPIQILVFNKMDYFDHSENSNHLSMLSGLELPEHVSKCFISAISGEGLIILKEQIADALKIHQAQKYTISKQELWQKEWVELQEENV